MKETVYETFSAAETHALGKKIGETAKPGDVYTLVGDLGVGKTVFTQGIADGLGITEPVSSPTFTIVQVYEEGRMPFYHFDVYRIADIEEMDEIGYGIECDCPWEPEHSCLILVRNEKLLYVGESDSLDPWGEAEDYHCIWES